MSVSQQIWVMLLFVIFMMILGLLIVHTFQTPYAVTAFPSSRCPRIVVLLTTSLVRRDHRDMKRQLLYEHQIQKWLSKTSLPIIVVENSNVGFPNLSHERLTIVTFDMAQYPILADHSSFYEWQSLKHSSDVFLRQALGKNDYVLKVTGRYYLDGIQEDLSRLIRYEEKSSLTHHLYLQKRRHRGWQNSEYYAMPYQEFQRFLDHYEPTKLMEESLYDFMRSRPIRLLPQYGNAVPRGGDGLILNPL